MNSHRLLRILAIITSISSYIILIMGSIVTNTGSGQGCGNSWPFCHGQIIPGTITVAGLIEYSHRVTSSVDGLLVVALTAGTWFLYRRDFRAKFFGFMSLFFVILQGALGALTVVYEGTYIKLWLLSVHFGLSLVALASVVLLTIRLYQLHKQTQQRYAEPSLEKKGLQYALWGLAALTYIVVYTGALVEHAGAVAACGQQVVGCGSTYLPNLTSLAGIQVLHRYAAASLWLFVLAVLVVVVRSYSGRRDLVRGAWWAFILITLQAISGMINVFTEGQLLATLLHITIISLFFSVLCYLCVQVGWPWRRNRNRVQQPVDDRQLELKPVS